MHKLKLYVWRFKVGVCYNRWSRLNGWCVGPARCRELACHLVIDEFKNNKFLISMSVLDLREGLWQTISWN